MEQELKATHSDVQLATRWLGTAAEGLAKIGHSHNGTGDKILSAHEHLYLEGNQQHFVYILIEGTIGTYKTLADGRRQIIGFVFPGDMLGLDQEDAFTNSAEALSECKVRYIPTTAIDKLILTEPGFGQTVMRVTSQELVETRELLVSLGKKTALEKLATFLLRISRRVEASGQDKHAICLPMKRGEIGDYLGLTIETVSRNFTKLKSSGIIELVSNSNVHITDYSALEVLANG